MFRSFRKRCPPFTNDLKASWTLVPEDDQSPQFLRMAANWTFLIPFFESKGYYPYVWDPAKYVAVQPDRPGPSRTRDPYPYGRRFYDSEEELDFYYIEVGPFLSMPNSSTNKEAYSGLPGMARQRFRGSGAHHTVTFSIYHLCSHLPSLIVWHLAQLPRTSSRFISA